MVARSGNMFCVVYLNEGFQLFTSNQKPAYEKIATILIVLATVKLQSNQS
jgi:hypothetical protein